MSDRDHKEERYNGACNPQRNGPVSAGPRSPVVESVSECQGRTPIRQGRRLRVTTSSAACKEFLLSRSRPTATLGVQRGSRETGDVSSRCCRRHLVMMGVRSVLDCTSVVDSTAAVARRYADASSAHTPQGWPSNGQSPPPLQPQSFWLSLYRRRHNEGTSSDLRR